MGIPYAVCLITQHRLLYSAMNEGLIRAKPRPIPSRLQRCLRSNPIAGIQHIRTPHKILLHAPHTDEATQQRLTARLVVRSAGPRTSKRLLPHHRARALTVDIEVARGVPERVLGEADRIAVAREDAAGEGVVGRFVDGAADVGEGVGDGVVVDVDDEDGAEELGAHEGVGGVGGGVDGGVDEVTHGIVVVAADEEVEIFVGAGVVDDSGEFAEGGGVDDGADEVGEVVGQANGQLPRFLDQAGFELRPERGGDVGAGGGGAFLALVLEGAADGVDDGVFDVGAAVDEVEVLAAGFADDARVALVGGVLDAGGDLGEERAEDGGAAGVVQGGELGVGEDDVGDLFGVAGDELDDVGGETGFDEDGVEDVVGGDGGGGRFPDDHVAHQGGRTWKVAGNGGEVEGCHCVDEAFQRAVFDATVVCQKRFLVCKNWKRYTSIFQGSCGRVVVHIALARTVR